MKHRSSVGSVLVFLSFATFSNACGHVPKLPAQSSQGRATSPLGSSYLLVPLPSEETSVLGRVLPEPPKAGVTLEEIARPNPCGSLLSAPTQTPSASTFEDAQELSHGVQGRAVLGSFGFSASAAQSTHFVYKLQTEKRIATFDTNEYVQCCSNHDCGYGFVSALVYGDAEYVAGEETTASAGFDFLYASANGDTRIKALQRRKARGWMAALVTVTDRNISAPLSPIGGAPIAGVSETTLPEQVRALYKGEKLKVEDRGGYYGIRDGRGQGLTENEFVRRFRNVSGSTELDDFEHSRSGGLMLAGGISLAVGGGLLAGGLLLPGAGECADERGGCFDPVTGEDKTMKEMSKLMLLTFGGAGVLTGGILMIIAAGDTDGHFGDHDLSIYDARLYVERHNRALLRKAARDVQRHSAQDRARVDLNVGPGSVALSGRF